MIVYFLVNLYLGGEESELCASISLEGDFEIRDEKHDHKREGATEANTHKMLVKHTWLENLVF